MGHAQAKIIKKSMILFWLINMTIGCKHVHRLELQEFLIFVLRIHQLGDNDFTPGHVPLITSTDTEL